MSGAGPVAAMRQKIERAFEGWGNTRERIQFKVNRLVVPVEDEVDALAWLSAQNDPVKIFWSAREDEMEIAAIGSADVIKGAFKDHPDTLISQCRKYLSENPGLRYYGGFAFQADDLGEEWAEFGPSQFILPRFEIVNTGGVSAFVCNLIFLRDSTLDLEEILASLDALAFPESDVAIDVPKILEREDFPPRPGWDDNVNLALDMMRNEVMEKIVLARKATLKCDSSLEAAYMLKRLKDITSNCYHFCFQPAASAAFIGATPERLIQRKDKWVWSEAVAGTRTRGKNDREDDELAQQLLTSRKDHLEHDIVRKSIRQRLHLLCESLQVDESVRLLRLATKQHLFSGVKGKIRPEVSDGDLIHSLHPTPAVGGYPTENALSEIKHLEPFNRGWYAAPVGWVSRDAAEFSVAIRSGLIQGNKLSLYSGAGIVPGSTPDGEWDEIENKISDFLSTLDG